MLKGTSLLESGNLYSPKDYEKNGKIIKKFSLWIDFKIVRMRKIYCTKCKKYKEFKKCKISCICCKILLLSSICDKCWCQDEKKYLWKKNQLK